MENFPGYPDGVSGQQMMADMRRQAERFGADIRIGTVTSVDLSSRPFHVVIDGEKEIKVTLKGNEQLEVTGLPEGATYTIDESGTDAAKYTSTTWVFPGGTGTGTSLGQQTIGTADAAITVTNTRDAVTPTGLLLDAAPYGAMLALAVGSGAVVFRKRRCD